MELSKKSRWIENVPPLATTVPGYSDMFAVNERRFAVPLKGVGGGGGGARILVVDFGLNFDGKRLEVSCCCCFFQGVNRDFLATLISFTSSLTWKCTSLLVFLIVDSCDSCFLFVSTSFDAF